MARLCLPAMNGINPDLTFTVETAEDFKDNKLPTLDFTMQMKEDMRITHGYYEKDMKSQLVIGKESAMGTGQKFSILSNEIARRLYSIEDMEGAKIIKTSHHFPSTFPMICRGVTDVLEDLVWIIQCINSVSIFVRILFSFCVGQINVT